MLNKLRKLLFSGDKKPATRHPLSTLTIIENILEPGSWITFETPDVLTSLQVRLRLQEWPHSLRLYRMAWSRDRDVTPYTSEQAQNILNTPGHYYAVIHPAEATTWALVAVAVIALLGIAATVFLRPTIPTAANRNSQSGGSSNNALAGRENAARPGERVPDIFGTVRSYPDLIGGDAWIEFMDNQEVEKFLGCVGNGHFHIRSGTVLDDDTPLSQMPNAAAEFYGPGQGVNTDAPFYTVGPAINDTYVSVKRNNGFDGPTLRPPDDEVFRGNGDVIFKTPNVIEAPDNFSDRFYPGDALSISDAVQYRQKSRYSRIYLHDRVSLLFDYVDDTQIEEYGSALALELLSPAVFISRTTDEYGNVNTEYYNLAGRYPIAGAEKIEVRQGQRSHDYCRVILDMPGSVNSTWDKLPLSWENRISSDISLTLYTGIQYDFNGQYTIAGVGDGYMTLVSPGAVSDSWNDLAASPEGQSASLSATLASSGLRWTPHVILTAKERTMLYVNYVAGSGAFSDDGRNQKRFDVELVARVMPIDTNNNPIEAEAEDFYSTIIGSAKSRDMRGTTLKAVTRLQGPCAVKFARRTSKTNGHKGTVISDVKLRDVYEVAPLRDDVFGDTTKVKVCIPSTSAALAVKRRKFNAVVTRKLPRYLGSGEFSGELHPTNNCADILCAAALDPYIGRREKDELDYANIYAVLGSGGEVEQYTGTPLCAEFCYTFDSADISDQEALAMIADKAGCTLYRRGSQIRVHFEKATDHSRMLFCHRNKWPRSEKSTRTYGQVKQKDGVIYRYTSP